MRDTLGATLVVTTSPVPLHATFTKLDVRVANMESKSRIRAAVSEFVERHPDVRYFHSYEMVMTAERQSDYFREDGRHVHRHAVKYIVSEFLRLFGDPSLQMADVDSSWLTPIEKTAATVGPQPKAPRPPRPPVSFPRRVARKVRREVRSALGRASIPASPPDARIGESAARRGRGSPPPRAPRSRPRTISAVWATAASRATGSSAKAMIASAIAAASPGG